MRLKELRTAAGKGQMEVAQAIGVARNTYSQYEIGSRNPDITALTKLANYFDVSVDYLIENDSDQQKKPTGNATPDELVENPLDAELRAVFYSLNPDDQKFFLDMMRHRSST